MRALALLPVRLWLLLFVAAPALVLAAMALATVREGVPPFALGFHFASMAGLASQWSPSLMRMMCLVPAFAFSSTDGPSSTTRPVSKT